MKKKNKVSKVKQKKLIPTNEECIKMEEEMIKANEKLPYIKLKEVPLYEVTYKFKEQEDYNSFMEAQTSYTPLRLFVEELEMQLRAWRKYGSTPEALKHIELESKMSEAVGSEIEDWYYAVKKDCIDD